MEYKDYYQSLGVPRTATQAEIKRAFRKLARQHHPDVKPGDRAAEQRFKDVNEANEVLSDPAKRKQYDALGADWERYARAGSPGGGPFAGGARPFGAGAGGPFDGSAFGGAGAGRSGGGGVRYEFHTTGGTAGFSDFFRMFFGGEEVPEAFTGAGAGGDVFAGLDGRGAAGAGAGRRHGPDRSVGTSAAAGRPAPLEADVDLTLEEAFHGTARIVEVDGKRLEVQVPRGVDTGSRIRLRGKGGGSGPDARDLVLVARVRPHAVFTRSGADLTREVPITLEEALLGAGVPVTTLKGRVLLTIPPGTQPGRMFRLAGQGMPRLNREGTGDLYVPIRVVLPAKLSDETERAACRFLDLVDQPNPRLEP